MNPEYTFNTARRAPAPPAPKPGLTIKPNCPSVNMDGLGVACRGKPLLPGPLSFTTVAWPSTGSSSPLYPSSPAPSWRRPPAGMKRTMVWSAMASIPLELVNSRNTVSQLLFHRDSKNHDKPGPSFGSAHTSCMSTTRLSMRSTAKMAVGTSTPGPTTHSECRMPSSAPRTSLHKSRRAKLNAFFSRPPCSRQDIMG